LNTLNQVVGNKKLMERLREVVNGRRFFHACIISGGPGTGKHTLAEWLAAAAICKSSTERPCGRCHACQKLPAHPDIIRLERKSAEVKVEDIRALRSEMYLRPNEAERRVIIIEEAEALNISAQNTLLNLLEEPPTGVLFILETENEQLLLPTVSSRCVSLRMNPLSDKELIDALTALKPELSQDKLNDAVRFAEGSLGRALSQLSGEKVSDFSELLAKALVCGSQSDLVSLSISLESMKRDEQALNLAAFKNTAASAAALKYDAERAEPGARALAGSKTASELSRIVRLCDKYISYCASNVGAGHIAGGFFAELVV